VNKEMRDDEATKGQKILEGFIYSRLSRRQKEEIQKKEAQARLQREKEKCLGT